MLYLHYWQFNTFLHLLVTDHAMRLFILLFFLNLIPLTLLPQGIEDSLLYQLTLEKEGARAKTEYRLAKYYYNAYEDSLCEIHLKNSINLAEKSNDPKTQAIATNLLGNLVSDRGRHEQAITLYEKAIEIAEGNDTLRASFMNNHGLELKAVGKYKEAVEVLYAALELKEKIGYSDRSISSTLLNIGLIWDLLREPEKALNYYERSLMLKKSLQDSLGISRLLSNISVIVKNQGELDRAISIIQESMYYNQTAANFNQSYINHLNLGNIYKKKGKSDLFLTHMDSAYFFASGLKNPDYLSDIHQNLGTYYYEQKNFDKAIEHLNKAIQIPGKNITHVLLYENYNSLADAYLASGDIEQAYQHLEISNRYRDSVYVIEHQKAIQEVREKYESEKKEKELALKNLELVKSRSEARRKTIVILFLVGGILVASFLAFMAFRHYRKKQRRKLAISEQRLQKYREEMELLRLSIQSHIDKSPKKINVEITKNEINQYLIDPLSEREMEILSEIASGKTNKEVAETIFISENTVKYHLKNIYLKLDVKNRAEAITKASVLNIWGRV